MTEWQGAIGLAQLERFGEQTERREQRSRYLAAGLQRLNEQGIGVAPLVRDARVTRWGFYMWHFKFLPERWDGVTRDHFLRALRAEGVPCGTGHTQPLYQNPLFQDAEHAFGRTGFPVRGEPYGRTMDFAGISCPQTERIFTTEAVSLWAHPVPRPAERHGRHPDRDREGVAAPRRTAPRAAGAKPAGRREGRGRGGVTAGQDFDRPASAAP